MASADSAVLSMVWEKLFASELGSALTSASTLVGVTALGYRNQLVDVDLTAALHSREGTPVDR